MCDSVDLPFCSVMGKNVIVIVYTRWLVDFFEIKSDRTRSTKWKFHSLCVPKTGLYHVVKQQCINLAFCSIIILKKYIYFDIELKLIWMVSLLFCSHTESFYPFINVFLCGTFKCFTFSYLYLDSIKTWF